MVAATLPGENSVAVVPRRIVVAVVVIIASFPPRRARAATARTGALEEAVQELTHSVVVQTKVASATQSKLECAIEWTAPMAEPAMKRTKRELAKAQQPQAVSFIESCTQKQRSSVSRNNSRR